MLKMPKPFVALCWWTLICSLSAAPSFVLGLSFDNAVPGMLAGVATFIASYTLLSCTPFARRLYSNRIWRRTIRVGYGTRMALSLFSGLALIGFPFTMLPDMYCGILAVGATNAIVGKDKGFAFAYAATVIEGVLLNIILALFMLVVHAICRRVMSPDGGPRGFEVIPMATAAPAPHAHEYRATNDVES